MELAETTELAADNAPIRQMLLDEAAHKAAVKQSYQTNVKTIYFHLEEIIKKILAHKTKWTNKYNGDLGKIAAEVLKHKNKAKAKEKKYVAAKGKAEAAKALAKTKNKSWQKAKNKLKQKIKDAKKAKKALKDLYLKGLRQKAGEICMIRKIQCMVAKFNGEAALQTKYCGVCADDKKAKMVTSWSNGGDSSAKGPTVSKGATWSSRKNGYYIKEQHGKTNECYDFNTAKSKCEATPDCHGIATQKNVCGGKYRVTHGATATLVYYANWKAYNLWAYTLKRAGPKQKTVVVIGSQSKSQTKTASAPPGYQCPKRADKTNWANKAQYQDIFEVSQSGTLVTVKRVDPAGLDGHGWGMNLKIECVKM